MIRSAGLLSFVLAASCAAPSWTQAQACRLERGAVIAPAAFGPLAGDVVLDLSRASSVLADTPARAAGLTEASARGTLILGGRRLPAVSMEIAPVDAETRDFDTNILAILGWDVLGRGPLDLDLRAGGCRLRLTRRVHGHHAALAWRMIDGAPAVEAAISDGTISRSGLFGLDTAHDASRISGAKPEREGPADARFRLRAISIDDRLREQTAAIPEPESTSGLSGRLGTRVWDGLDLRLDPSRRRLSLTGP